MVSVGSVASQPLLLLSAGLLLCPPPDGRAGRVAWLLSRRIRPADSGPETTGAGVEVRAAVSARRPSRRLVLVGGETVAALAAVALHEFVAATFLIVAAIALSRLTSSLAAQRRADDGRADLLSAVGALMDEYAAGVDEVAALRAAAGSAGRYRDDFVSAATTVATGSSVAELRFNNPALARLNAACAVSSATGSRLGAPLAAVRNDLHRDDVVCREVRSALAAPRSSAVLLAGLPVVGVALGSALGAAPIHILLHTGWGTAALAVGTALDIAGLSWTMAMTRRATP